MTIPTPSAGAPAHVPHIGFGHVWHTRLRPRRHRFIVPTFFLLLPMRTLREQPEAAGVAAGAGRGAHWQAHGVPTQRWSCSWSVLG